MYLYVLKNMQVSWKVSVQPMFYVPNFPISKTSSVPALLRDIERLEGPALGSALVFRWCKISGEATPYGPRLCIQLPRNIRHFCVSVWATVL